MSSSPLANASHRPWSSSMMLISMRPIRGIALPFICAISARSSGSSDAKSQANPRYSGFAASEIFDERTQRSRR